METLPNEMLILIFELIPKITDKRQFLKTCILYNKLTKQSMYDFESEYKVPYFNYGTESCLEKFTLELCHDGYFGLIPEYYITPSNGILVYCLSNYNNVPLLELSKLKGCNMSAAIDYGALQGHIPVLDWCHENKIIGFVCTFAIQQGHLHVLKWLQTHDYKFITDSPWMCNGAAKHGHLEVLKFVRGMGTIWDRGTYEFGLESGNKELINWMLENGCPTK